MTTLTYTPIANIAPLVDKARSYFNTHVSKTYEWRKKQLEGLVRLLEENEGAIMDACHADIGKPIFEAVTAEVITVLTEVKYALSHLYEWMQPITVDTPIVLAPAHSYGIYESYGVVLIISPFNYPIQLSLLPLLAAVAAGNVCVLKPSESSPACSLLLANLLPYYLDPSAVYVVNGGVDETTALLSCRWDYIFFTGSTPVGRIVAKAAAEHLTPVTLELGGKSPAIVDQTADLSLAASRIIWGKLMNAGQSCIAPDHILVHTDIKQQLLATLTAMIAKFYTDNPQSSPDYGRIINKRQVQRLAELIQQNQKYIKYGGKIDEADRYISPTLISLDDIDIENEIGNTNSGTNSSNNNKILDEEIFGPILSLISYKSLDTAIRYINTKPKPLALYIFSQDKKNIKQIIDETSSGGISINDTMMHWINTSLPSGGVGNSGMGSYHGRHGFVTLSHFKPIVNKSLYMDVPQRYPPYTDQKLQFNKRVLSIWRISQHHIMCCFGRCGTIDST